MQENKLGLIKNSEDKLLVLIRLLLSDHLNNGFNEDLFTSERLESFHKLFRISLTISEIKKSLDILKQKLIISKTNDKYYFTPAGEEKSNVLLSEYNDYLFSEDLVASDASKTFREIAIKLRGQYLGQFNMTDNDQLQKLITLLKVTESHTILDLGCGLGYITEYIQQKTTAHCIGLDIASGALKLARKRTHGNNKLKFVHGDMNVPDFPPLSFDVIISIDTLYFVRDLYKTLEKCKQLLKPGGIMLIFYSQTFEDVSNTKPTPDGTKIAQIMQKLSLKYDYYDFTVNEQRLWKLQKQLLKENQDNFFKEHNEDIFNSNYEETKLILNTIEKNPYRRYLYHIKVD